eukprot:3739849-Lingulodinium_polyedra.AAC.1
MPAAGDGEGRSGQPAPEAGSEFARAARPADEDLPEDVRERANLRGWRADRTGRFARVVCDAWARLVPGP